MSDLKFWIVFAGLLCVLALTIVAIRFFERRRAAAMRAAGSALGLTPFGHGERFTLPSVELMRKRGRSVGAALAGEWKGRPIVVFDLAHRAGKSVSVQTVMMTSFDALRIPEFAAIERNFNRYYPTVDLARVDPAPEELRKSYLLFTRSGKWPFDSALNRWFAAKRGRNGLLGVGWSFEGIGNTLFIYRRGITTKTAHLASWLDEVSKLAEGFASRAGTHPDVSAGEISEAVSGGGASRVRVAFSVKRTIRAGPRDTA